MFSAKPSHVRVWRPIALAAAFALHGWWTPPVRADAPDGPGPAAALLGRGRALMDAQKYDAAVTAGLQAVALRPDLADAYLLVAAARMRMGEPGRALPTFREAARREPTRVEAQPQTMHGRAGWRTDAQKPCQRSWQTPPASTG